MKTLHNTYLNLCTQVYDLSKPIPPRDAYEFYRSYAIAVNGIILEPMCGTGRFLLPLVAEDFAVHGFDASQHMLEALHKKAKAQNLKVNVWQGLIEDINIKEKYQLIFIPSGSLGLIIDPIAANNALKKFYTLLANDGKLVFEAETLKALPAQFNVWRGSMYSCEDGEYLLASFLDLPLQNNVGTTVCRYELVDDHTIIQTETEILKVRLYEPNNLCDLLIKIGFKEVKMIKAFDINKESDPNDQVIVYECTK